MHQLPTGNFMSSRGFPPFESIKDISISLELAETIIKSTLELTTFGTFMPFLSAG